VSEPVKALLREALKRRREAEERRTAAEEAKVALKTIVDEQGLLRANLERLPAASAAYKRYLEKFDTQETEIEKLHARIDSVEKALKARQQDDSEFLANATAE
jgi:transcriptional regulator of NAD metabolism